MPPALLPDDEEQYASSEDSDFAPERAQEPASDQSDSEDHDEPNERKRNTNRTEVAEDAGYDNSGDEAIIKKDAKRKRRAKDKGAAADEDEGGEGGLVKTRAQRAAEYVQSYLASSS